jgi:aprataxin
VSTFTLVLRPYANSPSNYPGTVYLTTPHFVVIYDRYPKAARHVLILPRDDYIDAPMGVRQLGPQHAEKVAEMHALARVIVSAWTNEAGENGCLVGYHATPSLHTLHLHVLTADLDGPALTKRIHWNSFTTPFFVPATLVDQHVGRPGGCKEMALSAARCEEHNGPMRCPLCGTTQMNIPSMKSHHARCRARR